MTVKSRQWLLLAVALAALPVEWALAQQSQPGHAGLHARLAREGYRLGKVEAEQLEAALISNPDDLATRAKLIGYYFRGAARQETPEARIAARRRHILWLIEHHPGSELAGLRQVTIDAAGHAIADKDGYERAAKLWLEQVQRNGEDRAVLGNAAGFFLLPDKVQAEALLKRAGEPTKLGYLYAIGILGLDRMNENGFPISHNPKEAKGEFARRAREELEKSADAAMVGTAGMILIQYGVMLDRVFRGTERPLAVDYAHMAEVCLTRAQQLAPAEKAWQLAMEEFRKLRDMAQRK